MADLNCNIPKISLSTNEINTLIKSSFQKKQVTWIASYLFKKLNSYSRISLQRIIPSFNSFTCEFHQTVMEEIIQILHSVTKQRRPEHFSAHYMSIITVPKPWQRQSKNRKLQTSVPKEQLWENPLKIISKQNETKLKG